MHGQVPHRQQICDQACEHRRAGEDEYLVTHAGQGIAELGVDAADGDITPQHHAGHAERHQQHGGLGCRKRGGAGEQGDQGNAGQAADEQDAKALFARRTGLLRRAGRIEQALQAAVLRRPAGDQQDQCRKQAERQQLVPAQTGQFTRENGYRHAGRRQQGHQGEAA